MRVDLARSGDDAEIRRLLRENPMEGEVRLTLEREPSCELAAGVQGDSHQTIVARDGASGRLLGMGGRSVLRAWVNGEPRRVEYLSQLRLDKANRGRVGMIREGYRRLAELRRDDETSLCLTTIVEDNLPARRLLEAGLPGLPRYVPLEPFVTLVLPARRGATRPRPPEGLEIDRAVASDLNSIVGCLARSGSQRQLAPVWGREELLSESRARGLGVADFLVARRGGRLAGCLAVWDQRAFKQSVVRGYGGRLRLLRPMIKMLAWAGAPRLPAPGEALRHAFLSHVAVEADDTGVLLALVERARGAEAHRRGLDAVVLGIAERDPLHAAFARQPHREYRSVIYEVLWNGGPPTSLDGRVPHLEAAIL